MTHQDKGPVYDRTYSLSETRVELEKTSAETGVAISLDTTMVNGVGVPTVMLALRGYVAALFGIHGARSLARILNFAADRLEQRAGTKSEYDTLLDLVLRLIPTLPVDDEHPAYVRAKRELLSFITRAGES